MVTRVGRRRKPPLTLGRIGETVAAMAGMEITTGQVDLWWVQPEQVRDPDVLAAYRKLLNDHERARMNRFLFERHRHTYLVAHALVRTTLSHYAATLPNNWRFVFNDHGRPDIDPSHGLGSLQFNLTHTNDLAVVAVARSDVGVDAEDVTRRSSTIRVAEHFFAPDEVDQLQGLQDPALTSRFFDFWTLKEAYIKARGMGLALPLHAFSYDLRRLPAISIGFRPPIEDVPGRWRQALFSPNPRHRIAVAMQVEPGGNMCVHGYQVTPLQTPRPAYSQDVPPP